MKQTALIIVALVIILSLYFIADVPGLNERATQAQMTQNFSFIAWSDQQNSDLQRLEIFSELSDQASEFIPAPDLTIFVGDLQGNGFDSGSINMWEDACDGKYTSSAFSNGMFIRTFACRGNHDDHKVNSAQNWQSHFNFAGKVNALPDASHYNFMPGKEDLVYSFDYQNSHFVTLDAYSSQEYVDHLDSDELDWLDTDLTQAENNNLRNITNTFIYFHVPIYCAGPHCNKPDFQDQPPAGGVYQKLINIINQHETITATFHAHEHVAAYTYLDQNRIQGLTHSFHHFISGRTGGGERNVPGGGDGCSWHQRHDFCFNDDSFILVQVNHSGINATIYQYNGSQPVISRFTLKPNPNILLTKTSNKNQAKSRDYITYYIQAYNDSNFDAIDVEINDSTPSGTLYVLGSATQGGWYENSQVVWQFNSLGSHQQKIVEFEVQVE